VVISQQTIMHFFFLKWEW